MNIIWHGQTCFKITSQPEKNGQVNILIDPLEKSSGLRVPKPEADVFLLTDETKKSAAGQGFLVSGPGEYDIKGVYIQGIPASKAKENPNNTIYVIEAEDIRICHLGLLTQAELTSEQLEAIGAVDILMIPIGGQNSIGASEAVKIMSQIEPKITVPMYYKIPKITLKLDELGKFLKVLGIKSLQPQPKLSVKKKDLSEEEAKIIALTP